MSYPESLLTIQLAGSQCRPASTRTAFIFLCHRPLSHSKAISKNIVRMGLCLCWFGRHPVYLLQWKNIVIKSTNSWQLGKKFQSGNPHLWPFLVTKTRTLTKSFRRMKEKGDEPGVICLITANWKENARVTKKSIGKCIDSIEKMLWHKFSEVHFWFWTSDMIWISIFLNQRFL